MREIVILGSTGSVGRQALELIAANPERFCVQALGAGGSRLEELADQILDHGVRRVGLAQPGSAGLLKQVLVLRAQQRNYASADWCMPDISEGPQAMSDLAALPCDVVLNAITGSIGLAPTLSALEAGTTLALANKESLVAGGPLVRKLARAGQIVPVDSEHSALAQALRAGSTDEVRRLILTASGGPFRGYSAQQLESVTVTDALQHPTWNMGTAITINCATLVNKGLEVIETHELFDVDYSTIEVVVHPQSIVHSMVEYVDGSTIAQANRPDMKLPISLALDWPNRVPAATVPLDWTTSSCWEFAPLDETVFPAVSLACAAGMQAGCAPAIFNAANENCVAAFVAGKIGFSSIVKIIDRVLSQAADKVNSPRDLADVTEAQKWACWAADQAIAQLSS